MRRTKAMRERNAEYLAERLFFDLEKQGDFYSLRLKTGGFEPQHNEESRLASMNPSPRLQILFDEGTRDAEIERMHVEAATKADVDPASVEVWIIQNMIVYRPLRDD